MTQQCPGNKPHRPKGGVNWEISTTYFIKCENLDIYYYYHLHLYHHSIIPANISWTNMANMGLFRWERQGTHCQTQPGPILGLIQRGPT